MHVGANVQDPHAIRPCREFFMRFMTPSHTLCVSAAIRSALKRARAKCLAPLPIPGRAPVEFTIEMRSADTCLQITLSDTETQIWRVRLPPPCVDVIFTAAQPQAHCSEEPSLQTSMASARHRALAGRTSSRQPVRFSSISHAKLARRILNLKPQ